jgi:uncharacterized protein YbbK (DUF523 family)
VRIPHQPDYIDTLRVATAKDPLRVLISGCLVGLPCGMDGSDYGLAKTLSALVALPTVHALPFCPEHLGMGTPRTMPDIHGGDGFDVLDGRARVLDEHGTDLTEQMLVGARGMLAHAQAHAAELAIMTDMSAACGSQVISLGCRLVEKRQFTAGVGVATALLLRNGVSVTSQRDHRTIGRLRARLDPSFTPDPAAVDYHECEWYVGQFKTAR